MVEVCPDDMFVLSNKIIEDTKGFEEQEKVTKPEVETILYTKTYNAKNLPEGVTEEEMKKYNLIGKEVLKVSGTVNLPIETLVSCFKHPELKKVSNPKNMVVEILENNYLGDPEAMVTFTVMNSGSGFVSNRMH